MTLLNLKQEYLQLSVFFALSFVLSVFLLWLSYSISKKQKGDVEKLSAYECGFDPFGTGGSSFEAHFYIVGVLFIIFDLEILFLYPWAVHLGVLGLSGFSAGVCFLAVLTVGFIYEWQKGALDWSRSKTSKPPARLLRVPAGSRPPKVLVILGCPYTAYLCVKDWFAKKKKFFFLIKVKRWGAAWGQSIAKISLVFLLFFGLVVWFRDIGLLAVVLVFLVFAATREAFGFRWTLLERHQIITNNLVLFLIIFATVLVFLENSAWFAPTNFFHQGYIISNFYTGTIKLYLVVCTVFFLIITAEYLFRCSEVKKINLIELPLLICFSLFFMLLLVSSYNIFGAYVAIEGLTFSLYILAGMNYKSQNCLEAGMKYFCLGALASGFFLFGVALVFITTKTLDFSELRFLFNNVRQVPLLVIFALVFIIFGVWFKLAIFPCHIWTPDVYDGVLTPITLFIATVVKFGVFAFLVRVLFFLLGAKVFLCFWRPVFFVGAISSIMVGGLGALRQTRIKRFIGYTSINQMGYLLIGISSGDFFGLQASFLFLFFYIVTGFVFFAVLLQINDFTSGKEVLFINQLNQFGSEHRYLAFILSIALFSMAGIPPLVGFFGKFFLFFSAYKAGNLSLIIVASVMNVISAFYYLRLVKCMFFEKRSTEEQFLFFSGEGNFNAWLLDGVIGFFFLVLVLSPVFLNMLLIFFGELSLGASWVWLLHCIRL